MTRLLNWTEDKVDLMLVWSILTEPAWKELRRKGRLRASRRHVAKEFIGPYVWMADQMERRLKVPRPSKDILPLWAWYQWEGNRRKPDLRASGHLPQGDRGVRVEFQATNTEVLLSDFDLWHYVLNYWYLPESDNDDKAFEKKLARLGLSFYKRDHQNPLPDARYRRAIERSWERIFDIEWADRAHSIAEPPEKKSLQATLWEIRLEDVAETNAFTGR
jgi:hypothetical protein